LVVGLDEDVDSQSNSWEKSMAAIPCAGENVVKSDGEAPS